jgi:hypothetical protein
MEPAMSQKDLKLSSDDQIGFFLPVLTEYTEKLAAILSRSLKKDINDAEWWIIVDQHKAGKLLNHHFLSAAWDDVRQFLQKQQKLFCFIEEKQQGLVESTFKIWVFFTPAGAAEYFRLQADRPKDFHPRQIQPLPYPSLLPVMLTASENNLTVNLSHVAQVMEKALEIIDIAEFFLDETDRQTFHHNLKQMISKPLAAEIEQLQLDIDRPAQSSGLLKRRLTAVLKLSWRFFRAHNELETSYFKKLLSDERDERMKGLKLAAKKVSDHIGTVTPS